MERGGSAPPHPPVVPGPRLRRRIDCSDTTQSLQVGLERWFKKSFLALNVKDQEVEELFLVSPQNTNS